MTFSSGRGRCLYAFDYSACRLALDRGYNSLIAATSRLIVAMLRPKIHLMRSTFAVSMRALVSCRKASMPALVSCRKASMSALMVARSALVRDSVRAALPADARRSRLGARACRRSPVHGQPHACQGSMWASVPWLRSSRFFHSVAVHFA